MGYELDYSDRKPIGGETVSAIGIGTWAIRDYDRALDALRLAVSHGIDNFDTAEMYDNGRAEELIGRLARTVGRDRIFITTKLLPQRFRSRESAVKAARASLKRLGVKVVDLILIHWPDYATPLSVQIRNLEAIAAEGLARYIGVSNFSKSQLEKALTWTRSYEIVVNQVKYSILDRSIEHESLLDLAKREGVTIQAYTPLERGAVARDKFIMEIANKVGKTPVQVALNYLISHHRVVAIPKTERGDRVREFVGAMGWRLPGELIEKIKRGGL